MKYRDQQLEQFLETMAYLQRRLWSRHAKELGHTPLNPSHVSIMHLAASEPKGISVKDIAAHLEVTSGAVTQLVDGLVAEGLLERHEDSDDRRVVRVSVTRKARSKFAKFRKLRLEYFKRLVGPLSEAELEELIRLLNKVAKEGDMND